MALAAPSSLRRHPTTPAQAQSPPCASRLRSRPLREPRLFQRLVAAAAATAATAPLASSPTTADTERRKHELLRAVQETRRGFAAGPDQRAAIEEAAVVAVEERGAGEGTPLDLAALDGTWRLCYTSASDVLVLFEAAERLPPLQARGGAADLVRRLVEKVTYVASIIGRLKRRHRPEIFIDVKVDRQRARLIKIMETQGDDFLSGILLDGPGGGE